MAGNMIDDYLAELDKRLLGRKAAIVAEIADGLAEAVEYHRARGLPLHEAQRAAIAEFGETASLANEFAPEIAARRVRRYGFGLMATGPLIGTAWFAAAFAGSFAAVPWWLTVAGVATFVAIALVMQPLAAYTTAAMGPASRWIRLSCHAAARGLLVTAVGAITIDVSLMTALAAVLVFAPTSAATLPAAAGVALSIVRIAIAVTSVQRLADVRALTA
ncbi:permease prefix domain 1-containing protein [Nocardia sp. NPDC051052]|uniref:permease prefix domain 1-containing protein n=1 Tax=Nocardia sp. NPDC051052 TaxID=3364322 RepID=UPI00379A11FA